MIATRDTASSALSLASIESGDAARDDSLPWQASANDAPYVARYLKEHQRSTRGPLRPAKWCLLASLFALATALIVASAQKSDLPPAPQPSRIAEIIEEEEELIAPSPESALLAEHALGLNRPLARCLEYLEQDDFNGAQAAILNSGLSLRDEDQLLRFVATSQQRYAQRVAYLSEDIANLLEQRQFQEAARQVSFARRLRLCNTRFLERLDEAVAQLSINDPRCLQTISELDDYGLNGDQRIALRLRFVRVVDPARIVEVARDH